MSDKKERPPYKWDEYIHFRRVKSEEVKEVKARKTKDNKISTRKRVEHKKIEVSPEYIKSLNLENKGVTIPYSVHNVINVERYLIRYWCPLIGSDACMLYIHLCEYTTKDNDFSYAKLVRYAEKLKRSLPTIDKNLQILEDNNFIIVFHRLNKKADNKETSPLIKIRETIPLLSVEQVRMLPLKLQEQHEEYLEKFVYKRGIEPSWATYDSSLTLSEIQEKGEIIVSKKKRAEIKEMMMLDKDIQFLKNLCQRLGYSCDTDFQETVSQQGIPNHIVSYFFSDSVAVFNENEGIVHLILKKDRIKELSQLGEKHMITDRISNIVKDIYGTDNFSYQDGIEKFLVKLHRV